MNCASYVVGFPWGEEWGCLSLDYFLPAATAGETMSNNGTDAPAEAPAAMEEPVTQVRGLNFREPWASEFCGSLLGTARG